MSQRLVRANIAQSTDVGHLIESIRDDLNLPGPYPAEAVEDICQVDLSAFPDHTDIPFLTIDPPGAADLDQAMFLEREGDGYLVRYAISAVGLFIRPGGALDREVHERGVTYYGPDQAIPLHPRELSAGAASLLPGQDTPAYLWYIHLDSAGAIKHTWVEYARVRSHSQLTYQQVQDALDNGTEIAAPEGFLDLLSEIGRKRIEQEIMRGGISLDLPEQVVEEVDGGYELSYRAVTDVEEWNAQISLLTGMAAAQMMLGGGVGILRTMPPARERDYRRLRLVAKALGMDWPEDVGYPDFVRSLDSASAAHAAFMNEAILLFRGASYLAIHPGKEIPDKLDHSAIAAPYAHVTAPLRRLVDRYGLEICRAMCAEEEIPAWVLNGLKRLPKIMAASTQKANAYDRAIINAIEALILSGREGEEFSAVVTEVKAGRHSKHAGSTTMGTRGTVMLHDPAVEAKVYGTDIPVGKRVRVRLDAVSPEGPEFELVGSDEG